MKGAWVSLLIRLHVDERFITAFAWGVNIEVVDGCQVDIGLASTLLQFSHSLCAGSCIVAECIINISCGSSKIAVFVQVDIVDI